MTPPRTSVPIYCADRARFDTSPRYGGPRVVSGTRPPDRIGRAKAKRSPWDGGWYCDWCGAKVAVAW